MRALGSRPSSVIAPSSWKASPTRPARPQAWAIALYTAVLARPRPAASLKTARARPSSPRFPSAEMTAV